jgi:hypothetical protein
MPISAQDPPKQKTGEIYLGIQKATVDSATVKNALASQNGFILNRLLFTNTISYQLPLVSQFSGTTIELGWKKLHTPMYRSSLGFQFGSFSNSGQNLLEYSASASTSSSSIQLLSSTKLHTARLNYTGSIYFLQNNPNQFLKNIGLDVGAELYGNQVNAQGMIGTGYFNFFYQREIKHGEGFFNIVLGLSYYLEFMDKHRIDFGFAKIENLVAMDSAYSDKGLGFIPLGASLFPSETKITGKQTTTYSGQKWNLGYKFSINEKFGIRLNYSQVEATHTIEKSSLKSEINPLVLFAGLLGGGGFNALLVPILLSQVPAQGPYPISTQDKRQFFSLEFVLML